MTNFFKIYLSCLELTEAQQGKSNSMTPYLKKRTLFPTLIQEAPAPELQMVVVIPAYDEPGLIDSLEALSSCNAPDCSAEVIVVINHSEKAEAAAKERNYKCYEQARSWSKNVSARWLKFHLLYCPDLPHKHAGVGMARKIGMDEACRRLESVGQPNGIITGFDADSRCDPDYFQQVYGYFQSHPKTQAASIYFEHPLQGAEFSDRTYRAITLYELHLRYFINAQAWAGLPFAYQTIGSSMAVRCRPYQKQGGMNRRKAGEDFYFLHKFTMLEDFGEVNTTRVIPSSRPSHRVPFGTGKAIGQLLENQLNATTYAPAGFVMLRQMVPQVTNLYHPDATLEVAPPLGRFLASVHFEKKLTEMRQHTSTPDTFYQRFFRWFDAFMLMKYVHFIRDEYQANVPVREAANWLTEVSGYSTGKNPTEKDLLLLWRSIDRSLV